MYYITSKIIILKILFNYIEFFNYTKKNNLKNMCFHVVIY